MAWIAVEGPTCAGKSTLFNQLHSEMKSRQGFKTNHMSRPEEHTRRWVLGEYVLKWENLRVQRTELLSDRWHWGEATYSPVYRPETNKDGYGLLGQAGWRWTELFLLSRGAVTAYLHASPDTLIKRLEERGDDHVQNVDELLQVAKLYNEARSQSPTVKAVFDTGSGISAATMRTELMKIADRTAKRSAKLDEWPGYIGSPLPAVLLVGYARNITKRYGVETRLPFMPVNGNSGEYLLTALPDPYWKTVGIVNGSETKDLRGLWLALQRPPVVALGQNASSVVRRAGMEAAVLPHPAYVRRFMNDRKAEYGEAISKAARTGKAVF